jgi:hypothetical protein
MSDLPTTVRMPKELIDPIKKTYDYLTPEQMELIDHLVRTGDTQAAASRALGKDQAWICNTLKKPYVLMYMQELAEATLVTLGTRALHKASDLLDSRDHRVGAQLAIDLMNRAGIGNDTKAVGVKVGIQINV